MHGHTPTQSDPGCLFCKIVSGAIPCKKISETDTTIAFLDIYPTSHGHALIIPKHHTEKLHELPDDAVKHLGSELVRVSKAIVKATGCSDYNVLQVREFSVFDVRPCALFLS
jgi:diadenosine tetraphosphate (Ap4A) HIT family hydrolase